jgi:hypothetical protein
MAACVVSWDPRSDTPRWGDGCTPGINVAKEKYADLILLGARGRRGWRHMFHRTLADRVRRKALTPVVTLDADDRRMERDSVRWGVPGQRRGSGREVSHSAKLVGAAQDTDGSHRFPHRGARMNYLWLIDLDEQALRESQRQEGDAESVQLTSPLQPRGQSLAANPRHPTATSVRVCEDNALVTDGPFAETREQLGG